MKYVLPFLTQLWMFATPVVYSSASLNQPWRTLYGLNPMVGVVDGFRWAITGAGTSPGLVTLVSAANRVVMLVGGTAYFRKVDQSMADVSDGVRGNVAIRTERLSKRYVLGGSAAFGYATIGESLANLVRGPRRPKTETPTIWALRDVSFEIEQGETVASSAATAPARARCSRSSRGSPSRPRATPCCTAASARCSRSAPASTGELTGRENIYLNGAILGMHAPRDRPAASTRSSRSRRSRSSSTRRSSATRAACTCGWPSRSPRTSSPRS